MFIVGKPPSREGSRDRSQPQKSVPQKDILVDKNKGRSRAVAQGANIPPNKDPIKGSGVDNKDKLMPKLDNLGSRTALVSSSSVSMLPSNSSNLQKFPTNTSIPDLLSNPLTGLSRPDSSVTLPAQIPGHTDSISGNKILDPHIKDLSPEDPTLPTRFLDLSQFKAPEDLEGEEDKSQKSAGENATPDMGQLTQLLQKGMGVEEVAQSLNIRLDDQTAELLHTLKQQLDLAAALAKQTTVPGAAVGTTFEGSSAQYEDAGYSNGAYSQPQEDSRYSENQNVGTAPQETVDNHSGVKVALAQMLINQQSLSGGLTSGDYSQNVDYQSQDPTYTQAKSQDNAAYYSSSSDNFHSYPSYSDNPHLTSDNRDSASFSVVSGKEFSSYRADSQSRSGESLISSSDGNYNYGSDSGVSSGNTTSYGRYGSRDSSSSVQKQYSYGSETYSDGEGVASSGVTSGPRSQRVGSSSSYPGGGTSVPSTLLGSPPFKRSVDSLHVGIGSVGKGNYDRQFPDEGKRIGLLGNKPRGYRGMGGQYGRGGGQRQFVDTGRNTGHGDNNRTSSYSRENW